MEIEDLFRSKLENSEVVPGCEAGRSLMRKVWRREFFRFNPSRINIYYVGGTLVAGIAATLLFTSVLSHEKTVRRGETAPKVLLIDSTTIKSPGIQTPAVNVQTVKETITQGEKSDKVIIRADRDKTVLPFVSEQKNVLSHPSGGIDSLLKKDFYQEQVTGETVPGLTIQKKLAASFEMSVSSGCIPVKVKFSNTSVAFDSCYWTFGDGGFSTDKNPEWIFDVQGEYRINLQVFNKYGAISTAEAVVFIYPRPVSRFEVHPDNPIIPDDEVHFVNTSMDGIRCRWIFGDGTVSDAWEPVHKYDHFDNYNLTLIVWSEHGCTDSLTVHNAFAGSGSYITFPNAFIPNPDGPAGGIYSLKSDEAAQIFHPVTSGVNDYQLRIFSKVGILIFESNDINIGWDGYHKGQLCDPGVYVWKVRGTYKNGEPFVKMGDVTLLKK